MIKIQARHIVIIVTLIALSLGTAMPVHALSLAARISDQSTEVLPGDRLYFEIEVKYPENPRRKDLRIEYQIKDGDEVVASEKVLRAVETQASFLDYIVIPESTTSGIKELNVVITDYESLHQEISATFRVLKGQNQIQTYFFILLSAIAVLATLVVVQIVMARRRPG